MDSNPNRTFADHQESHAGLWAKSGETAVFFVRNDEHVIDDVETIAIQAVIREVLQAPTVSAVRLDAHQVIYTAQVGYTQTVDRVSPRLLALVDRFGVEIQWLSGNKRTVRALQAPVRVPQEA
jgi:hypothetical protein